MDNAQNKLINRELEPNIKQAYEYCADRIDSLVDYCCDVLKKELYVKDVPLSETAPLTIFRHILGLLDSISQLLRTGSSSTAKILARSLFESYAYLLYLSKADTARRNAAYLIFNSLENFIHDKKNNINVDNQYFKDAEQFFFKPPYKEITEEYERKQVPHWYSLFGGPATFKKLVAHLDLHNAYYKMIYSDYSESVHGTNSTMRYMKATSGNQIEFAPIRDYDHVGEMFAVSTMLGCLSFTYFVELRKISNALEVLDAIKEYSADFEPLN